MTSVDALRQRVAAGERLLHLKRGRSNLTAFTRLTMPHPDAPDDFERSLYEVAPHHQLLGEKLDDVVEGRTQRLAVMMPPRHGKSEKTSRRLPAYHAGRFPHRHAMVASYNQNFADDFGRAVRSIMQGPRYGMLFPNVHLRKGEGAADRLRTEADGLLAFVGRGGTITGRGADLGIIDDPFKGSEEADSAAEREKVWKWYNADVISRSMTDAAAMVIVMTRWHEDDLLGRLLDPGNPCYDAIEAARWDVVCLPALAEDGDILGREPGAALWPERFGKQFFEDVKRRTPHIFSSLYQQRPSAIDGEFFKKDMLVPYKREELPKNLRLYATSDHAVSMKEHADRTCLLVLGIDQDDVIWIVDCTWRRMLTDQAVEAMVDLMERHRPLVWYAGRDHIAKSLGPFLKKRMRERKAFIPIEELSEIHDKKQKAQPLLGRMSMGMVRFPAAASWLADARDELLKFPNGRHDDFVDALANFARKMDIVARAPAERVKPAGPKVGTLAWVKYAAEREGRHRKAATALRGM